MWTKEERDEIAPTALSSVREIHTGMIVFVLICGRVHHYQVTGISICGFPRNPYIKVFMERAVVGFRGLTQEFRATDIGLVPYHTGNGPRWNDMNMVFQNMEDAVLTGTHPHYSHRDSRHNVVQFLRGYLGNSTHGRELAERQPNPNLEQA